MIDHSPVMTAQRNEEFWNKISELAATFPELVQLEKVYAECDDDTYHGKLYGPFDESAPVYVQGMVLIVGVANTQGYETHLVLSPRAQPAYLSDGLVVNAYKGI